MIIDCRDCGKEIEIKHQTQKRCPVCQAEHNRKTRLRQCAEYAKRNFKRTNKEWVNQHAMMTHVEISKILNVSRERVRQIENKALRKLQNSCLREFV